jgi:hypothetical protein
MEGISVLFDKQTGYTKGIYDPRDDFAMNWILENSDWGAVEGFAVREVEETANGIIVRGVNKAEHLQLVVEKSVTEGKYVERYQITNIGASEFFLTRDNFGIHFPYNCTFEGKEHLHDTSCVAHVWCGGDVAWMYAARPNGKKPFLVCQVRQGSFSDYSLHYDVSRAKIGVNYRGGIVLHPTDCEISAGESAEFVLEFSFSADTPDVAQLKDPGTMRVSSKRYSVFTGESVECRFECADDWDRIEVLCNDQKLTYKKEGRSATWQFCSDVPGDYQITVRLGEKKTWMKLHVLEPLSAILQKRAAFITEKQQYHKKGSTLDGAYLIYDRSTQRMFYNAYFGDHNACAERLSMGVIVARALQQRYDEKMMESLKKHREFIEREIFDKETGRVSDGIRLNARGHRVYNYTWISTYYLEWYRLTGDVECLKHAANILFYFYENLNGAQFDGSLCMKPVDICHYLEKEGLAEWKKRLASNIVKQAELILANGLACCNPEVKSGTTHQTINGKIYYLCQAYLLCGEEKYLAPIDSFLEATNAFRAFQPDFHINGMPLRYWDLYWFAKFKSYGDSMPHWISVLTGEVYELLYQLGRGEKYHEMAVNIVKNNLCVYMGDGFASEGYLFPYKVVQYSSDPNYSNPYMPPKITYGHAYDDYANDQDWALYFATRILKGDEAK